MTGFLGQTPGVKSAKHVLVTGGAGFIGSHLVERLLADGKPVVVIDDCSTGRKENLAAVWQHPGFKFLEGRISDRPELAELAEGAESIYHLAAAVGVDLVMKSGLRTIETNLRETQCVLNAADARQTPVLITSTSEVYGKSVKGAFAEEDDLLIGPPHFSRWSYACSKLMDEFLALAHAKELGTPVTIARLFNTVGPRQTGEHGMALPRFIAAAKRGEPLRVFGDGAQTRCFCYVADTVEALLRLQGAAAARGEVCNVGSEEEVTIKGLAEMVLEALGSTSTIEMVPYATAYPAGFEDMLRRRPNVEKLARLTQFRARTSLAEIIRLTAQAG
ncbi:MAG TPA: NAD-dependent epimerase/dehydratase family protein [Verrucomicrobiae bacterium]|jgi:UDP-glucose 4-epimerase|nr:NAD-dependent epimerase/dehydratase family protein [Verrucomicrobiae bacterium]